MAIINIVAPNTMQRSRLCLFLLILACIGVFLIRANGIKWPKFHPDEGVIGAWLERSPEHISICDRVYPNGFFMLARPFAMASRAAIHIGQQWNYFCGTADRVRESRPDGIFFGRWFNVWAGTLTCLIIFLLVSRMVKSQWAGLTAACLVGFAQYAVEHSHYAETDIAALLVLSVFFLCLVMAVDSAALRWLLSAAFIAGFAAGTKFTLVVLAPIVLLEAVLFATRKSAGPALRPCSGQASLFTTSEAWPRRLQSCLHALKFIGLSVLLFMAGFVLANPDLLYRFQWFWSGLAYEKYRVYNETKLNLGMAAGQDRIKYLHHLQQFHVYAMTLGPAWLGLIAAALPCLALRMARRYLSVLLIFPLLFAFYWIFAAPWVRSQEFLLFLPSCAALAVIPLVVLWRNKHVFGRAVCLAVAAAAMAVNACNGLRVSELFGWKDTRLSAREWLQTQMPLEDKLAAEFYAEQAAPATLHPLTGIRKVEQEGIGPLLDKEAEYFLRAANVRGRGLSHPLTGALYPGPQRNFEQFMQNSTLLAAWAPLPPHGLATFASPVIELYGLKRFEPKISLRAEAPQPALIVNADQNQVGRQTFCRTGHKLGCAGALLIDRMPQTIAIGGPESLTGPVYLVLNTAERPAIIHVRGFGLRRKIALEPYDTAVVPLQRTGRTLCKSPFETVTLSAEPVRDIVYIPCFARVVFTVPEAVRIFLDTGRADRINRYFSDGMLSKELSIDLQYLIARGRSVEAGPIAALKTGLEQCCRTNAESVSFNGVNGYYFNRFARARLQPPYDFACGPARGEYERAPLQNAVCAVDLQSVENVSGAESRCVLWEPPLLIAHGRYELRGEMMIFGSYAANAVVPLDVYAAQGDSNKLCRIDLQPGKWIPFSLVLRARREVRPCLKLAAPVEGQIRLRNMELVWSLASVLASIRDELSEAEAPQFQSDKTPLCGQPQFGPWLRLVGFNFDAQRKEAHCVFETLQDDVPPLAVTFWLKRHGEWRRRQVQSLTAGKQFGRGETIVLTVRLKDELFKHSFDARQLGLGVETAVLWHPGVIPALNQGDVVPLASLH